MEEQAFLSRKTFRWNLNDFLFVNKTITNPQSTTIVVPSLPTPHFKPPASAQEVEIDDLFFFHPFLYPIGGYPSQHQTLALNAPVILLQTCVLFKITTWHMLRQHFAKTTVSQSNRSPDLVYFSKVNTALLCNSRKLLGKWSPLDERCPTSFPSGTYPKELNATLRRCTEDCVLKKFFEDSSCHRISTVCCNSVSFWPPFEVGSFEAQSYGGCVVSVKFWPKRQLCIFWW